MRIATWNVNSVKARLPRLLAWLGSAAPDVLCLQELKVATADFPSQALAELGYASAAYGTGRWNGVAVISRVGLDEVTCGLQDEPGFAPSDSLLAIQEPRAIGATCGGVRLWSLYVPNGRSLDHAHYDYKLRWLDALAHTATAEMAAAPERRFALLGDFNIAPTDADVWDITEFAQATHVSAAERDKLRQLAATGLSEVPARALKYDTAFTYWDYRALGFAKNRGMRIDLVYGNPALCADVTDAYVDREARKGQGASDHAPVVLDLAL